MKFASSVYSLHTCQLEKGDIFNTLVKRLIEAYGVFDLERCANYSKLLLLFCLIS